MHRLLRSFRSWSLLLAATLLLAPMAPIAPLLADEPETTRAVIAVFELKGAITEKPAADDFPFAMGGQTSLQQLLERLRRVTSDANVKGVVLLLGNVSLGRGQVEEIRQALDEIQRAGKPIYSHADSLSNGGLLLLSGATHLAVSPTGDLFITGIYAESPYLRGLLDKIGVEPDFFTCGKFKSAGEMYMLNHPSQEAKENLDWLVDGIFANNLQLIAQGRHVTVEQVRAWIDQGLYSAESAQKAGVIDAVQHRQDFLAMLRAKHGADLELDRNYGKKKKTDIDLSSPLGLLKLYSDLLTGGAGKRKSTKDAVAIVHVEGPIVVGQGEGSPFEIAGGATAYSTPIRKALDEAAADDTIKAVVLRVDSPGGSAVASEIILDATKRVKAKKPLVISMGNVAGSGGYYVACGAETIFADPSTITGSIGVVVGKLGTRGMWDKLGVNWEPVKRGARAGMMSSSDPFTEQEREELQKWMNEIYEVFKGHVTAIRGDRLKKDLDELAGGRVFTGKQALDLGLVDRLGGLHDAIKFVASEAHLEDYEVRILPEPKSFVEALLSDLNGDESDSNTLSLPSTFAAQHWSLLEAAHPYLRGIEGQRLQTIVAALRQLELLQQDRVMLTMPLIRVQ